MDIIVNATSIFQVRDEQFASRYSVLEGSHQNVL